MEVIMPRKCELPHLLLDDEQRHILIKISQSQTKPVREVQRAKILLKYADGIPIATIGSQLNVSRPTIYKCIEKALATGIESGLKDKYHRPKQASITDAAKAWVINVACQKPKDLGYAAEVWSLSLLAKHTRQHAPQWGHECLKQAAKATVQRILKSYHIRPHNIRYYIEKRDPEFDKKMHEVLIVYKEVNLINIHLSSSEEKYLPIVTVSVDEKPGIQAIKNTTPDLPPVPNKQQSIGRDYEYHRLGTLSLLAGLDLHTGRVIAQVHGHHRSKEFILLLKKLDSYYPSECQIRLILDNHSSHISKETMKYLESRPNRFIYVHTPKHGSWLNLVETLFGKMARTFLKNIRVNSIDELKSRILKGIDEINEAPVVHQWKNFDFAK
jgi:transposase